MDLIGTYFLSFSDSTWHILSSGLHDSMQYRLKIRSKNEVFSFFVVSDVLVVANNNNNNRNSNDYYIHRVVLLLLGFLVVPRQSGK